MSRIAFVVKMRPIGVNHAYVPARWGSRHGMRMTEIGHAYKATVHAAARRAMRGRAFLEGSLAATIRFFYPDNRSDIDGAIKPTLDAMQGAVYANDRAVRLLREVAYCVDRERPRVEIEVEEITP